MSRLRSLLSRLLAWITKYTGSLRRVHARTRVTHTLGIMTEKGIETGLVVGVVGLRLQVKVGSRTRLVGPSQCAQQSEFVRIWGQLKGTRTYTWEDGTPYDPWLF